MSRRAAAAYLLAQSVAVSLWWAMLFAAPRTRRAFLPDAWPDEVLLALMLPDMAALIGAGFLAAWGIRGNAPWAWPVLAVHAGAMLYATLFAFAIPLFGGGGGALGALLMAPPAAVTGALLWLLRPSPEQYSMRAVRGIELEPAPLWRVRLLTFAQIVVVWTVFLVLLPALAWRFEDAVGLGAMRFGGAARALGWAIALVAAPLNLALAWHTTARGRGTPLPFAAMPRLVVTGAYAHVRNPMLMVSVAVGAGISLAAGSPTMLAMFAVGAVFWNMVLRPWEERDLLARFGAEYAHYRRHVRCWVPRRRPYRAPRRTGREGR